MMCERLQLLGLIALAIISVTVPQQALADALSARQIERKIIGHTWAWKSEEYDASGVSTYFRDGRLLVMMDGWDRPHRGRWQIKGNQICSWLTGNNENCSKSITQIDDKTFFWESSKSTFILKE